MSLQDEEYFENEYYTYNIRFFKLIGISHYETSTRKKIHVCFFNLIIAIASFSQIYMLFTSELKVDPITELLETTLPSVCFTLCYYNLLSNVTIMKRLLFHIRTDWDNMANKPELMILRKYANRSRLCTIIIAISFYLYIATLFLPSVVRGILYIFGVLDEIQLILPVPIDHFLKNGMEFYFVLFNEYASLGVLCTIGIAHTSIFVSLIHHACALFKIVVWKIEEGYKSNSRNFYHTCGSIKFVKEYQWIIGIIRYYDNVIDFVDLMKQYHGKICIFEATFAMLFIVINILYTLQILSFVVNMRAGLQKCSYIIGSMFVIYAYHYLGQKLIDHHTEIYIKLCEIPFYSLSLKTQKMLPFLIMKSTMPCNLSIKGVIVLSHYLFATLMRTSFSYAMIFYKSS